MTSLSLPRRSARITDLTEGSVHVHLLQMTGSVLLGFVVAAAFNIIDTYFVSKLGANELAAMAFILPVSMVIFGLTLGLAQGTNSTIARAIGAGRREEVQDLTLSSIVLGLIVSALLIAIGLWSMRPLFIAMGATEQTLPLVMDYMRIWYLGMFFQVIPVISNNIQRATGDMLTPSLIMIANMGLNIGLDPVLIFGWGPIPAMGIKGAAMASVICRGLSLVAVLLVLVYYSHLLRFRWVAWRRMWEYGKEILINGVPVAVVQAMMPLSMGFLLGIVSNYGQNAVAAMSAGLRLEHAMVIPIFAVGAASIPFGGQNWGNGRIDRIRQGHRFMIQLAMAWGVVSIITYYAAGRWIAMQFTREPAVLASLMDYLWIMPFVFGFRGLNHIACCLMNAIRHPLHAAILTFMRFFVFVLPLAGLGSRQFGFRGFLVSLVVADITCGLISTLWVRRIYTRRERLDDAIRMTIQ